MGSPVTGSFSHVAQVSGAVSCSRPVCTADCKYTNTSLLFVSHKSPVHSAAPGAGLVKPGRSASRQAKLDIRLH